MKVSDRTKAAELITRIGKPLYDLGVSGEVDDHGQLVLYPPDGYGFSLCPYTGALVIIPQEDQQ